MKIYLFYDEDGFLFAHTSNKKFYKRFKEERIMDRFTLKKIEMDFDDYDKFTFRSCDEELTEILLDDGNKDFIVIGTVLESYNLDKFVDDVHYKMNEIIAFFECNKLKDKYKETIDSLTDICEPIEREDSLIDMRSKVNTLSVFYKLNKNTLIY